MTWVHDTYYLFTVCLTRRYRTVRAEGELSDQWIFGDKNFIRSRYRKGLRVVDTG